MFARDTALFTIESALQTRKQAARFKSRGDLDKILTLAYKLCLKCLRLLNAYYVNFEMGCIYNVSYRIVDGCVALDRMVNIC